MKPFQRLVNPSLLTTYDKVCSVDVYFSGLPSVLGGWLCILVLAESCRQLNGLHREVQGSRGGGGAKKSKPP